MSYGSLFFCGNGKRGCLADVANMELHVHRCPAPCRGQLLIMAYGFLENPDAPSESFLPLSAGLQGHHTQWVSTDTRWSPELSWCCPSPACHVGFSGTPHQLPRTQNSTRSCFVFSCLFRFWIMNFKLAQTLLSFINKYSPGWDCFSFNYIFL